MKKIYLISAAIIIATNLAFSQGAAINSTGAAADNSAMLDVSSTSGGLLIPRMLENEKTAILSPATGLMVYQTDGAGGFYYYDGAAWEPMSSSGSSSGPWSKTGNDIYPTLLADNVGIGTSNPAASALLEISSTDKGLLIPRMTTLQRDAILSPATGLQVFNTDCNGVDSWNGTCWLSMLPQLKHPGEITASSTVFCSGTTQSFSISAVQGASSYIWSVPPGASVSSGQGTISADVLFGDISGEVCVVAFNSCTSSPQSCIKVNVNTAPSSPGVITGPVAAARGTAPANYYITPVAEATTYNWTVPSGASIISGTGTSNIIVSYPCASVSGNVSVNAENSCGISSSSSAIAVTLGPVANAGNPVYATSTIGGTIAFPTASGGTGSYTYSWTPLVNLNSYTTANPVAQCTGTSATYTVMVTDGMGCTATSSVLVTRGNSLIADAGNDQTIAGGAFTTIGGNPTASNASGPFTYSWSPSTGLSGTTVANPTVNVGSTTTYTVTVTGSCATSATASVTITVTGTQEVFNFTGTANEQWTVPAGVTSVKFEAWGAQGAGSGGMGGYSSVTRNVTPGDVFYINVGGMGSDGSSVGSAALYAALNTQGFNGGGAGRWASSTVYSGGGGGASDVRLGGTDLSNRILVGGGGGSVSKNSVYSGGSGGFPSGTDGTSAGSYPGRGGTQTAGGNSGGTLGTGGMGIAYGTSTAGGSGGGGYYGGGGGGNASCSPCTGGGGGGSSYYDGIGGTAATGVRSGNGLVVITY